MRRAAAGPLSCRHWSELPVPRTQPRPAGPGQRRRRYLAQADVAGDGQREGQRDARAVLRHGGPRAARPGASSTEVPRAAPAPAGPATAAGEAKPPPAQQRFPGGRAGAAAPHDSSLLLLPARRCLGDPWKSQPAHGIPGGKHGAVGSAGTVPVQEEADAVARVISFPR